MANSGYNVPSDISEVNKCIQAVLTPRSLHLPATDEVLEPKIGGDPAEKARKERCKKRRQLRILCEAAEFGCCPDGLTVAAGPFHKDCPEVRGAAEDWGGGGKTVPLALSVDEVYVDDEIFPNLNIAS